MKLLAVILGVVALFAITTWAQSPRERDRPVGPPPPHPLLDLFDTDKNGELSLAEMDAAASVLKQFDRDGDRVVTREELPRPPRPQGDRPRGEGTRAPGAETSETNATPGTVFFRNGYETDRRDGGRPVVLIAAALGVSSEVFRDAFSKVTPARDGRPSETQVRANKQFLMDALGKYGVSNERLDTVSNYYRYQPQSGELWTHAPAKAKAIIENGIVTGFEIVDAGAGYSTPPSIVVAGHPDVKVEVTLNFTTNLKTNGSIATLNLVK